MLGDVDPRTLSQEGLNVLKAQFWTALVASDVTALLCDVICLGIELHNGRALDMVALQAAASCFSAASASFGIFSKGSDKAGKSLVSVKGVLKQVPASMIGVGIGLPFSIYAGKHYFRFEGPGTICLFLFWTISLALGLASVYVTKVKRMYTAALSFGLVILTLLVLMRYPFNDDFDDIPDKDDFDKWLMAFLVLQAMCAPCVCCILCGIMCSSELLDEMFEDMQDKVNGHVKDKAEQADEAAKEVAIDMAI